MLLINIDFDMELFLSDQVQDEKPDSIIFFYVTLIVYTCLPCV